jgi:hypothetical protein
VDQVTTTHDNSNAASAICRWLAGKVKDGEADTTFPYVAVFLPTTTTEGEPSVVWRPVRSQAQAKRTAHALVVAHGALAVAFLRREPDGVVQVVVEHVDSVQAAMIMLNDQRAAEAHVARVGLLPPAYKPNRWAM